MRHIIYLAVIFFIPLIGNSQLPSIYSIDLEGKNFHTIDNEYETYFNSLIQAGQIDDLLLEGSDYKDWLNWRKTWLQRIPSDGNFDDYYSLLSSGASYVLPAGSTTPWHEIGPIDDQKLPFTIYGNDSRGNIGPLEFLTFNDDNPSYMLTGSTNGGLFYSLDGGDNWAPGGSDTQWDVSGCTWATFKKNDVNTWFATSTPTGRNVRPTSIGLNSGVYRTTDAGQTWVPIASKGTGQIPSERTRMHKVIILEGPNLTSDADDILLVSTSRGLLRSDNSIYTANLSNFSFTTPTHPGLNELFWKLIYDLDQRPNHNGGQDVFATVKDNGIWRIYKSSDWGQSWGPISLMSTSAILNVNEFPPSMAGAEFVTVEMSPADNTKLFCLIDRIGSNTSNSELWVYDIPSAQWETGPRRIDLALWNVSGEGHGIGISPINLDEMMYSHRQERRRSTNGGSNATYLDALINEIHDDIEDIVYHPDQINHPGEVWLVTHGGLFKSVDYGVTAMPKSDQIGVAMIYGMSTSKDKANKIGLGLNHNGTVVTDATVPYSSTNYIPAWDNIAWGDGAKPLIEYDSESIWEASQSGLRTKYAYNGAPPYSPSGHTIYSLAHSQRSFIEQNKGANNHMYFNKWNSNINLDPPTDLWREINENGTLEMITDFSQSTWYLTSPNPSYVVNQIYTTPLNPNYIYIGMFGRSIATSGCCDLHKVYRTTTAMESTTTNIIWKEIPLTPPTVPGVLGPHKDEFVKDIEISHTNPDIIFIAQNSSNDHTTQNTGETMVYKVDCSNMANIQYLDITYNLPKSVLGEECLALEKGTNEGLYISTSRGVFFTNRTILEDPSISNKWKFVGQGLPHVNGNGIEINYEINKVRVGTNGRGLWEHELECPTEYNLQLTGVGSYNEYWEVENIIESSRNYPPSYSTTYRAANKILLTTGFHYTTSNSNLKFHAFIHGCSQPGNSFKHSNEGETEGEVEEVPLENIDVNSITIYPNPNNGQFRVDIEGGAVTASIEVFDFIGKKVFDKTSSGNKFIIDIIDQARGIYFVKVTIGDEVFNEKIIKN